MPKLTAQFVRDLPLARTGQSLITDDALPGFGVRVGTRSKSYFAESRVKGRTRRVTLGRADTLTLNDARKLAMKALAEMADGKDRNAQLRLDRAKLMTLGQAVDGWLSERAHRERTTATYRATMQREFGDWLDMEMRRITPKLFQARFHEIMARTSAGAALAVRTFKSCWNWARADVTDGDGNPLLPECPADIVKRKKIMPKAKRRQTFVSDWKAFFDALDSLETNSNRHPEAGEKFKVYVELLARTGLRMTEAAYLEWADVDLKGKTLTIIAERSKNGEAITLPLSEQTMRLLEAQQERTGGETYVWGASPYGDPRKTLTAFREALGWPIGFHDLRRSFSTVATRLDVQQTKLKRLMNHSTANDVTAGYQILIDPEMMREAVQAVSDYIDQQRVA
jgi:integrase